MERRPNILLIISDQERSRGWVPDDLHDRLAARNRLRREGVELASHHTHSSPCSPSRASILTGQHVPEHGVTDNVFVDPVQPDLHTATPTIGHLLREAGYRTGYVGKWHLSYGNPDIERYGFSDWTGEDWAWTGLAGTGTHYDEVIAEQATRWLREHGTGEGPWCLVVGLVNPHDVAWYPADQPWYQERHPERAERWRGVLPRPIPDKPPLTPFEGAYEELFELPDNFDDDLNGKPAVQKQWRWEENHGFFGTIEHDEEAAWRRCLDYYWHLHELNDRHVGTILDALEAAGRWDDTAVLFTSDHGDQAASHGMRGKGPFAYREIVHVPCYVRVPGVTTPGAVVPSLTSSVDLAPTICSLAGAEAPSTSGVDLVPLLDGSETSVRSTVLFAQEQAWHRSCIATRFALRGAFDGRYKYVRYFGVGGGADNYGQGIDWLPEMRFGSDADFIDQEHELYDLEEDPGEMVNLAADPARRREVEDHFDRLRQLEAESFSRSRPPGAGGGSTHRSAMLDVAAEGRATVEGSG